MFCTNCGHEVQGKFCTNCGTPVAQAEDPAAPVYEAPAPAAPVYEAPAAPVYEAPAAPVYEAPAQPQYAPPQAPQYAAPAAPVAEEKPKKKVSAGKIVLFVLLGVLALIILLVSACAILVGKAANDAATSFEEGSSIVSEAIDEFTPSVDAEVEEAPAAIVESTGEMVYYEGLTYMMVDRAQYEGSNVKADLTLYNECEFGINNITDVMIRLYDANGDVVGTGNFFFDMELAKGSPIPTGDYIEFTVTFEDCTTGLDLSDCSVAYELMAHMYNDAGQIIGERVVTRMFEISLPAEWVGKVDYYMPDGAYGFYSIANDAAGADGTLFFIEYVEHGTYTGSGEYLGEDDWYEYYLSYPTGTCYDESDPALAAEYELFASQIDQAIYTLNIF